MCFRLHACLCVCVSMDPYVHVSMCLSVCESVCVRVSECCVSVCLCVRVSVCPPSVKYIVSCVSHGEDLSNSTFLQFSHLLANEASETSFMVPLLPLFSFMLVSCFTSETTLNKVNDLYVICQKT